MIAGGYLPTEVESYPDRRLCHSAQYFGRSCMSQQEMMSRKERHLAVGMARRVHAGAVAEPRRAPRLVQRDPHGDAVRKGIAHHRGVLRETLRRVPRGPAAQVFQRLREVPVVEGTYRLDPSFA